MSTNAGPGHKLCQPATMVNSTSVQVWYPESMYNATTIRSYFHAKVVLTASSCRILGGNGLSLLVLLGGFSAR